MSATGRIALFVIVVVVASPAVSARAQCNARATPAEVEQARNLFIEGMGDVEAYRWADAIPKFERSYSLSCAPSALYNLAMALRALGRHRESRDAFDQLLARHPSLSAEDRRSYENYRREESARVAVLVLAGIDPDLRPTISLDGDEVLDEGARPLEIETDSGSHSLVAQIPAHQPFLWEGRLGDGQRESIEVSFAPLLSGGGFDPLPLILAVAGAALIGAGIGVGVFLWDDAQVRPMNPERLWTVGQ